MPLYRHLQMRQLGEASERFRPRGGGSPSYPSPVEDRTAHARRLRQELTDAIGYLPEFKTEQARFGIPQGSRGMPVAVEGRGNEELSIGDLKLESRGLQLLNVQRASGDGDADLAVFFVSSNSAKSLLKALDKYEAYDEGDERRPQRFWLFESASDFRVATVEDLWTDPADRLPRLQDGRADWEVWIRKPALGSFLNVAARLGTPTQSGITEFVEMAVVNVTATREEVASLVRASAAVVELRGASSFTSNYRQLDPEERSAEVEALAERLAAAAADAPSTAILDSGVHFANPLLASSIDEADCHAIRPTWDVNDHDDHGTLVAGVALFGDLETIAEGSGPISLSTRLESVAVTAPPGEASVPAHAAINEAVSLLSNDDRRRVFCLAATAPGDVDDGRQTGTSAAVDELAWNDGQQTRLFCVAAGNVPTTPYEPYEVAHYEKRNESHRLQSPGQALNALTVGAATDKCPSDFNVVAPSGDLSPTSRTAQQWAMRYANKPDIVMEGGNHVLDDDLLRSRPVKETMVLTTNRHIPAYPLSWISETSAATARAAGLMTRLAAAYPTFRAETLRGMMVHSAEWTPAMLARFQAARRSGLGEAEAWGAVLDCFGWGIPDDERLFASAGNALTMIIEDDLRPFIRDDGRVRLREMKFFKLPWPTAILQRLNQEQVELRCTLSYFISPDPHAGSRQRLDRYASHRLRFDLKSADDTDAEAQRRINTLADEEATPLARGAGDRGWKVGSRRRGYGSLHHDIWTGRGHELARRDGISVYPVKGWWADRRERQFYDGRAQFSLIVSVRTPRTDVDLFVEAAAAATRAGINLVEAASEVRV